MNKLGVTVEAERKEEYESENIPVLPKFSAKEIKGITTVLTAVKKENGNNLVTLAQASDLANIRLKNGEALLSMQDRYFLYEVIWMLVKLDYEIVYNFLSLDWEKIIGSFNLRKKLFFENPLLGPAKDKFAVDMEIYRNKIEVEAGEKCRRCKSDNTISLIAQTRSADEAQTIKMVCLQCKFDWRAQ